MIAKDPPNLGDRILTVGVIEMNAPHRSGDSLPMLGQPTLEPCDREGM